VTAAPVLRVVLGDQLSPGIAALRDVDPGRDVVLMAEVAEEATHVRHHPQKIVLFLSAMRHFAAELERSGLRVDYVRLDDPGNTGTLGGEVARAVARHGAGSVVATEAGEWRLATDMRGWERAAGVPLEIREDDRFLCPHAAFAAWADGRKAFRMEHFYRVMRTRTGILMDGGRPAGGRWNFDAENRRRLPDDVEPPAVPAVEPDAVTGEVIALVRERFPGHFGDLDGFGYAVTRADAEALWERFVVERLPRFGDYQDAMARGRPFLFHAVVAPYLNLGLLDARTMLARVERAWRDGAVPLNAAEGFVRQILGWREYVRGIYWHQGPGYARRNAFGADRALPGFYWSGDTDMACLAECIGDTRRHAYAHHIQRLMVIGNFALLIGADPDAVNRWYLEVYADAVEWVQLPNTHGMALHADGGLLGSKPYAASGRYIQRMSDYCERCRYRPDEAVGPKACPFNALYWRFLARNRDRLAGNPRLAMPYRTLDRFAAARRDALLEQAERFLETLD
jgi:deoxyribodipyrimidine photolyase-related protein